MIALITANFGGIDNKHDEIRQEGIGYKRFYFNELNTPFPMPNLPPRLKARYFKTQSHKIPALKDYYIHCWIDAGYKITSPDFLLHAAHQLDSFYDMAVESHPLRYCVYDEINYIKDNIENKYFNDRFSNQPLKEELEYYWSYGLPKNCGLHATGVFIRNTTTTNIFFDEWWDLCLRWSWFDQTAFSFLTWKNKPAVNKLRLGNYFDNPYIKHMGHNF